MIRDAYPPHHQMRQIMKIISYIIRIGLFAFITMSAFNPAFGRSTSSIRSKAKKTHSISKARKSSRRHADRPVLRKKHGRGKAGLIRSTPPYKAESLNNQPPLYEQVKYAEVEPRYRSELAIREKKYGSEHPFVATSLNNLALVLKMQGKYSEAEPLYRRALAIREKQLGKEHPLVATSLNNLALLLKMQGKYAEAEPLYRHALAIREKQQGIGDPLVATSLNNLADLLQTQGKYAEADPLYRRTLEIDEKWLGADHPDVATDLNNLASLLQDQGKYAEA